jgi:phage protein D
MADADILPLEAFSGQDFYVPAFRLLIQGKKEPEQNNDVLSVTYQDSLTEIDSLDMTVNNWDAERLAFKYSDGNMFDPWKDVELYMGYYRNGEAELRRMLIGEITTLSPSFPPSGGPTLTVRALSLFHRFRTKQITRPFPNKRDTEIAEILVDEIGREINKSVETARKDVPKLKLEIDPKDLKLNLGSDPKRTNGIEKANPYLLVNNQYPILFLMERARRIGYELTLDPLPSGKERKVIIHFHRTADVKRRTYVLEWGKSLISFQPTLQMTNQVSEVTIRGWDPKGKTKFEEKATRADLAAQGIVNPSDLGVNDSALAQKIEITVDYPIKDQAEAKSLAIGKLQQIAEVMVEAKGKTVGLPDLRAGTKVQIKGLGSRFSGPDEKHPFSYLVTATTHTISDSGYTTDFTARMEKSI